MSATMDYLTRTEGDEETAIYTDAYDNGVWLNVMLPGASARAVLTRSQALALIESIQFALSAGETA